MSQQFKVRFIDSGNSKKNKLMPGLNGDNIVSELEALLNEMFDDEYILDRIELLDSSINTLMERHSGHFQKIRKLRFS